MEKEQAKAPASNTFFIDGHLKQSGGKTGGESKTETGTVCTHVIKVEDDGQDGVVMVGETGRRLRETHAPSSNSYEQNSISSSRPDIQIKVKSDGDSPVGANPSGKDLSMKEETMLALSSLTPPPEHRRSHSFTGDHFKGIGNNNNNKTKEPQQQNLLSPQRPKIKRRETVDTPTITREEHEVRARGGHSHSLLSLYGLVVIIKYLYMYGIFH